MRVIFLFVKKINKMVKKQRAFPRILLIYMIAAGYRKQADLLLCLDVYGHPYSAATLSFIMSGKRLPSVDFMVHVVRCLRLTSDQENALVDAYFVDFSQEFFDSYMQAKSRMEHSP